ncbi:MAG: aminoglycoside phosphotransferase family protein [Patescibacteria group bacterium]
MKIIEKLPGFSSKVFLVDLDGEKCVLKQMNGPDEVQTEKKFMEMMANNGLPYLKVFSEAGLKPNEILLEYVGGSVILGNRFDERNAYKWGELAKKIHSIKYDQCFKYDQYRNKNNLSWGQFLHDKHERSLAKAEEYDNYGFGQGRVNEISDFVNSLFNLILKEYSLIHGDFHTSNVLIRGSDLVLFDGDPTIFSGDPLYDLAIAWMEMPNGSLISIDDPEYANDKNCLDAFIDGYGKDFTNNVNLKKYIVLIAFSRLYTPFARNYKNIIENILNRTGN